MFSSPERGRGFIAEFFHSPGMKALFFHIEELVNSMHATAVPTKGSRASAAGGDAGTAHHEPGRKTLHRKTLS